MTLQPKYRALFGAFAALTVVSLSLWSPSLHAQQESKDATFSTDVNVVNIFATVRDKQLKIVNTMAKDDFVLSEDGHPQTIRYFSQETDLPLTLGLLVDTSLSQRGVLEEEKDASYRFLDQVLRPEKDQTFVIHFDHETELLQDLTSSRTELRKALDAVRLPDDARPQMRQAGQGGGGYPNGNGGRRQAGTTLYDAIFLASDEIMKKQHGRKALILLTDGVDEGSKTPLYEAIRSAQRSDTLVYSILFVDREGYGQTQQPRISLGGLGGLGGGMGRNGGMGRGGQGNMQRPDGKKILQQISRETGGGFFEVSKKESIDDIYKSIQEELRNQYSLGYISDQGSSGASFRHITLTARKSGVTVQAPEGYYPAGQ